MTDQLKKTDGTVLSIALEELLPTITGHKIINRLLDGTYHVQTIGEPQKEVNFIVYADKPNMNTINNIWHTGDKLRAEYEGDYFQGYLSNEPKWGVTIPGDEPVYNTQLNIMVTEEGSI